MKAASISGSFDPRRAGQVAAYFLLQHTGTMNVLKLVKLIYLADRAYMSKYEEPMLGDKFVSMRNGPVNSLTYTCACEGEEGWDEFVGGRIGHDLTLANSSVSLNDLDELSDADMQVLAETWAAFGHMNQWDLVDYTHKNCPEWEDPGDSSSPIPYSRVFKFLSKENADVLEKRIIERGNISRALASAKCPT